MRVVSAIILSEDSDASANGDAFDTNQAVNMTFQVISESADVDGSIKIQGSNDQPAAGRPSDPDFVPTNWSDIPNATSTITNGVAPLIVLSNVACQYMRAVFTRTGGGAEGELIQVRVNAVGV